MVQCYGLGISGNEKEMDRSGYSHPITSHQTELVFAVLGLHQNGMNGIAY